MTAETLPVRVGTETAERQLPDSGNPDSGGYAPVRAAARASVTGKAIWVWLRAEFRLPEFAARARPVWMWARYGEQCPPAGFARGLSRAYAALIALPVTVALVWGEWVVARPSRLAVAAILYGLLVAAGAHLPTPWRS